MYADALLAEEYRTWILDLYRRGNNEKQRREHHRAGGGEDYIEQSFYISAVQGTTLPSNRHNDRHNYSIL